MLCNFLKETFAWGKLKASLCSAYLLESEFQRISEFSKIALLVWGPSC